MTGPKFPASETCLLLTLISSFPEKGAPLFLLCKWTKPATLRSSSAEGQWHRTEQRGTLHQRWRAGFKWQLTWAGHCVFCSHLLTTRTCAGTHYLLTSKSFCEAPPGVVMWKAFKTTKTSLVGRSIHIQNCSNLVFWEPYKKIWDMEFVCVRILGLEEWLLLLGELDGLTQGWGRTPSLFWLSG